MFANVAAPPVPVAEVEPERQESAVRKAAIEKGLAETFVDNVRVDGLALMKVVKHAHQSHTVNPPPAGTSNATVTFSPAVGQLLGIDVQGTLQVSNAFALPPGSLGDDADSRGSKAAKYTAAMLPRLADLKLDASVVGFYVSANNGQQFATGGLVESLLTAQLQGSGLGAGSKASASGRSRSAITSAQNASKSGKGIVLVYDVTSAGQGNVGLKAYRLSNSFINAFRARKFDSNSLLQNGIVPSNMVEEVPVSVSSSSVLTAFLSTLTSSPEPVVKPAYSLLSLPTSSTSASSSPSLTAPLTSLLTALETHQTALSTLSFQSRQLAREKARLESIPSVARRRAENEERAKQGLPLLPPAPEEAALVEPSRLETMCALNAVQGAAASLSDATSANLVRSYGAKAGLQQAS